jgi:Integrase core domain
VCGPRLGLSFCDSFLKCSGLSDRYSFAENTQNACLSIDPEKSACRAFFSKKLYFRFEFDSDRTSRLDNSKLRDEPLNGKIFYSLKEEQILCERWRVHYNTVRPHSSLGYRPPAPEAWVAKEHGAWRSGNRYALPTSPHPRLTIDPPRS